MEFIWSTLRVNDFEESLNFYTEILGLEVVNQFEVGNGIKIAFLEGENSDTKIELLFDNDDRKTNTGQDISWGFAVKSMEETIAFLSEKKLEFEGPIQPNPSTKFIFIKDPNGMRVQLVENK